MARKQFTLKKLVLDNDYSTTNELFFASEASMNAWLYATNQGQWCKENSTDLTFRVNHEYNSKGNKNTVVSIIGQLEEEDYTVYILKFGGNNESKTENA